MFRISVGDGLEFADEDHPQSPGDGLGLGPGTGRDLRPLVPETITIALGYE
jgi:hypothetical protein